MSRNRTQSLLQFNRVEAECDAVRRAVEAARRAERLAGGKSADWRRAADNLDGTYLVRLFAVFESGLRDFWTSTQKGGLLEGERSMILTRHLIESVTARRRIEGELVAEVHAVREYRNTLTHGSAATPDAVPLRDATRGLATFLARLPETW